VQLLLGGNCVPHAFACLKQNVLLHVALIAAIVKVAVPVLLSTTGIGELVTLRIT
jgi:hypothetical protein